MQGILLALIAAALWGLTPVATKTALNGFSPEFLTFARLLMAAFLFRIFAGSGARWFIADRWIWLAGAGLGADFVLYNYGMERTAANVAGLVVNVELLSTIAFAVAILGERLNVRRIVGGLITLSGVMVVTVDSVSLSDITRSDRFVGNVLVMLAGISWSLFAVAQRRTRFGRNLFERLTPIFSVAAMITAPVMLRRGAWVITPAVAPVLMFIVLTVLGTGVVYWIYARAQDVLDVSVLSILLCAIPIFSVFFAYVLLNEPVTLSLVAGGSIIVTGIILIATESHVTEESKYRENASRYQLGSE
jgi:O-acetylserine/cysteine efflux transporter